MWHDERALDHGRERVGNRYAAMRLRGLRRSVCCPVVCIGMLRQANAVHGSDECTILESDTCWHGLRVLSVA